MSLISSENEMAFGSLKTLLEIKKKPDIFDSHFYVVKRDSRNAVDKLYGLTYKCNETN